MKQKVQETISKHKNLYVAPVWVAVAATGAWAPERGTVSWV